MDFNRREFLSMASALILCGPSFGKQLNAGNGVMVFHAGLDNDSYYVKLDSKNQNITKIKATSWPHAFLEHQGLYYGVEKKGRSLVIVNFDKPSLTKMIQAPDDYLFYGHCAIHENKVYVSAIRFNGSAEEFKVLNANTTEGAILIYDKQNMSLIGKIEKIGTGPHELVIHEGSLVVAVYENPQGISSLQYLSLSDGKMTKEVLMNEKFRHLKFKHFIKDRNQLFPILNAFNGPQATNVGIGFFNQKGTVDVVDYSNAHEKNLDYDHTTAFYHNGKIYVVLYVINRMLIFDKAGKFVDFGGNDFTQLKNVSAIATNHKNQFIVNSNELKKVTIKSHIYISS